MTEEVNPVHLHDKSIRGVLLSEAERALLGQWYAQQDAEEIAFSTAHTPGSARVLQEQIDAALGQVQAVTQRIQTLNSENETLRQEIGVLYQQLAQRKKAQTV